jgi:hypothetical protein
MHRGLEGSKGRERRQGNATYNGVKWKTVELSVMSLPGCLTTLSPWRLYSFRLLMNWKERGHVEVLFLAGRNEENHERRQRTAAENM